MSRRRDRKKKGVHPAVAVLILIGSAGFLMRSLWSGGAADGGFAGLIGFEEEPDMGEDELVADDEVVWRDLLELHGSYERGTPVRVSFAAYSEPVTAAAAPAGETAPIERARWRGEDPPMLRLGVVMVSDASRRAVLDGDVVGVGDEVGDATVTGIEVGSVRLRWRGRDLTYDLDGVAPREFREEQRRRDAERQDHQDGGDSASSAEQTEGEQG